MKGRGQGRDPGFEVEDAIPGSVPPAENQSFLAGFTCRLDRAPNDSVHRPHGLEGGICAAEKTKHVRVVVQVKHARNNLVLVLSKDKSCVFRQFLAKGAEKLEREIVGVMGIIAAHRALIDTLKFMEVVVG